MSTLYSHPEFPTKGPEQINQELMNRVNSNPLRLLLPKHITNYVHALWSKKASGQPVTFTDIFGMLIGETLIPAVSIWSFGESFICFCFYLFRNIQCTTGNTKPSLSALSTEDGHQVEWIAGKDKWSSGSSALVQLPACKTRCLWAQVCG